jgi:isoleucyl-tRNA synthetase
MAATAPAAAPAAAPSPPAPAPAAGRGLQEVAESKDYSFPAEEEAVLAFWEEVSAFETQLKMTEGQKEYVFYDGPP